MPPIPSKQSQHTNRVTEARLEQRTQGAGLTSTERRVDQLERTIASADKMVMLIYDIPSDSNEAVENPSRLLWNYGFRLNKSCWVLPSGNIDEPAVQEVMAFWGNHDVEFHVIPFAPEATAQIKDIARDKLEEELFEAHSSLLTRIEGVSQKLKEAEEALDKAQEDGSKKVSRADYRTIQAKHDNSVRLVYRQSVERFNSALACARLFDEEGQTRDLLQALREVLAAEIAVFNERMAAEEKKPVTLPEEV